MEKSQIIERFGGIIKEEPLSYIKKDILLPHTCVFEAVHPYFGYYSSDPQAQKPQHLYCALNGYYSYEAISRATQNVRKKFEHAFDAAVGNVTIFGNTCQAIRIRNLQQYSQLSVLQQYYLEEGIMFKKKAMKVENEMAKIKLRKSLFLKDAGDGIYYDLEQENQVYFIIPEQIEWEYFKKLTKQVKLDTCNFYFDGALAYIYDQNEIKDMIRIYRIDYTHDEIKTLKDKYYQWLKE